MNRTPEIDETHRKELMRFLLVKTAAVRRGVKPAELLRVRHCYETRNAEGFRVCLYRSDVYVILGLDYLELKVEKGSSLVLFYNKDVLAATLSETGNRRWLSRHGYSACMDVEAMLDELKRRAQGAELPHEVGIFIGYPLKDVVGFVSRIPSTPIHNSPWRVYGNAALSLERMRIYAAAEEEAGAYLSSAKNISDFINRYACRKAG